jgi:hypothetical protein
LIAQFEPLHRRLVRERVIHDLVEHNHTVGPDNQR